MCSGVAVGVQIHRKSVRYQGPEERRHHRQGWSRKVTPAAALMVQAPHVDFSPSHPPLCVSPVWCVRSGSLRSSTAPTTPSWSTCLHVSRRQSMCVLSWNTRQEGTSWCTYTLTSFQSHALCEFCSVFESKRPDEGLFQESSALWSVCLWSHEDVITSWTCMLTSPASAKVWFLRTWSCFFKLVLHHLQVLLSLCSLGSAVSSWP